MTRSSFVLAALTILAALPAAAHDFWIEPSSFRPAPGNVVTAALRVGQKLQGEPLPRIPTLIDRFIFRGNGPDLPLAGMPGDDPAGSVRVREPGLHWIGYQSQPYAVVLDATKFEEYLKAEGLERIVEERLRKGQSGAQGRERFYRCAKALLDVQGDRPAAEKSGIDVPLGFTLELVPLKSPYALAPGAELPVSLSFRGRPIGHALVVAIHKDDPDKTVSARTDTKGLVTLRLGHPGFWLVKAVHMEAAPPDAGVDWESWWASITFDLASSPRI